MDVIITSRRRYKYTRVKAMTKVPVSLQATGDLERDRATKKRTIARERVQAHRT